MQQQHLENHKEQFWVLSYSCLASKIISYADNTIILFRHTTINKTENEINNIRNWSHITRYHWMCQIKIHNCYNSYFISINYSFHTMHTNWKFRRINNLTRVDSIKYLGTHIDQHL